MLCFTDSIAMDNRSCKNCVCLKAYLSVCDRNSEKKYFYANILGPHLVSQQIKQTEVTKSQAVLSSSAAANSIIVFSH